MGIHPELVAPVRDLADPRVWGLPVELGRLDERGAPRLKPDGKPRGVAPELIADFPDLATHTAKTSVYQLYLETVPPTPVAKWWSAMSGWDEAAQAVFDAHWPALLDDAVTEMISVYGSQWHHAFAVLARTHHADYVAQLRSLAESGELGLSNMYRGNVDVTTALALSEGPVRYAVERRSWPYPTKAVCAVCDTSHLYDFVRYWAIRKFGGPGVCALCLMAAANVPERTGTPEMSPADGLAALARLSRELGLVPPQAFREAATTVGMAPARRARIIAALICTPSASWLREVLGGVPWIDVLRSAGLVGETWRPSRGVLCQAADGHPCRSLGERAVDDWLSANGYQHNLEPGYPRHALLNPSGRLRADWQVGDVYIEYVGMLGDAEYAAKIRLKGALARSSGIELVMVAPEDLYRLDQVLGAPLAAGNNLELARVIDRSPKA